MCNLLPVLYINWCLLHHQLQHRSHFFIFFAQIQLRLTRCSINDTIPHSVLKFIRVCPLHACILQHLSYPQVVVVILLTSSSFLADQTSRSNMSDDDCWDMDGGESAAADSLSSCYLLPSQTFQEVTITVYTMCVRRRPWNSSLRVDSAIFKWLPSGKLELRDINWNSSSVILLYRVFIKYCTFFPLTCYDFS